MSNYAFYKEPGIPDVLLSNRAVPHWWGWGFIMW